MLHGCTGPLFFALTVAIVVFTSNSWQSGEAPLAVRQSGQVRRLAVVTAVLFYLQIVFGAVLRHMPIESQPATFALAVRFHLLLAGVLVLHVALLAWLVVRHCRQMRSIFRLTMALVWLAGGSTVARRIDVDRQVRCARLGRGLVSPEAPCEYGRRLAADAHYHCPRGALVRCCSEHRSRRRSWRFGSWHLSLRTTKARRTAMGAAT